MVRPKLTVNAELALNIFAGFVENVKEFQVRFAFSCACAVLLCCLLSLALCVCVCGLQDAVDRYSVEHLRRALCITRHLRSPRPVHRQVTVRLLLLLSKNFSKFADWKDLVHTGSLSLIDELCPFLRFCSLLTFNSSVGWLQVRVDGHDEVSGLMHQLTSGQAGSAVTQPPTVRRSIIPPPPGAYYDVNDAHLCSLFHTDPQHGLSSASVQLHAAYYGTNTLRVPPRPSLLRLVKKQVSNFMAWVLLLAALSTLFIGDWLDALVLAGVGLINATMGAYQEYRIEQAFTALSDLSVPPALVIRDGKEKMIDGRCGVVCPALQHRLGSADCMCVCVCVCVFTCRRGSGAGRFGGAQRGHVCAGRSAHRKTLCTNQMHSCHSPLLTFCFVIRSKWESRFWRSIRTH